MTTELETLRAFAVRIANFAGITDPIQLTAQAENNEDTYADLLFKHVQKTCVFINPEQSEKMQVDVEKVADILAEALSVAFDAQEDRDINDLFTRILTEHMKPKATEVLRGCGICGGKQVLIRGKYPGDDKRLVCPTCDRERLDQIQEMASPDYGVPGQEKGRIE